MRRGFGHGALAVTLLFLFATPASAQVQNSDQQKCINALNKAGAKIADAQAKLVASCLKDSLKGKILASQTGDCVSDDVKGKVSKAQGKALTTAAKKCPVGPSFGASSGPDVRDGFSADLPATAAIFGVDLGLAIVDPGVDVSAAGCQAAASKDIAKVLKAKLKEFLTCSKNGLKDGVIDNATDLQICADAM